MKPVIIATLGEDVYVKAMRRASRQDEISRHGRPIEMRQMKHSSKKAYSRKNKYPMDYDY